MKVTMEVLRAGYVKPGSQVGDKIETEMTQRDVEMHEAIKVAKRVDAPKEKSSKKDN